MSFIKKLKIRNKIGLLSLVSLSGFLIFLIYSLITNIGNESLITQIGDRDYPILEIVNSNWITILGVKANLNEAILEEEEVLLEAAHIQAQQVIGSFNRIIEINPFLSDEARIIQEAFKSYYSTANTIATAIILGTLDRADILRNLVIMDSKYEQFKLKQDSFKSKIQASFSQKLKQSKDNAARASQLGLWIGAILMCLLFIVTVVITRLITQPLNYATKIATQIADGQWDIDIENTQEGDHDEISQLIEAFSHMKSKLHASFNDLELARDKALMAERSKGDFLATMSHEIRTPMNGIIGANGLLMNTELKPKQRSYAHAIQQSADALLYLINDILDISKIEAGKLDLEDIQFNLQLLVEEVVNMMAIKSRDEGLELLLQFKTDTPRYVWGDPGRIRQVLYNLLSNAIKFTGEGHVLLTVSLDAAAQQDNNEVRLLVQVQDTGIGIPKDMLLMVFNKFDQADVTTTRKYGGTGLGLAICKQLCQLMGGEVGVESEEGKGSTFWFTMTLKVDTENELAAQSIEKDSSLAGLKVLIVDDMELARTIIEEQVTQLGMRSDSASSADEAMILLRTSKGNKEPYNFVITDYHMPQIDGGTLAKSIKHDPDLNETKMVLMTSLPQKGDGQHFKELGFSAYLAKPLFSSELPKILAAVWSLRQQTQDVPLVTRHTIKKVKTVAVENVFFENTSILLTEDSSINQMIATEMLEARGCVVTLAVNGIEAVSQVKQSNFDLIFMDCLMPEMDGFEATACLRDYERKNDLKRTPIIAFTANAMYGDKIKCLNAGMDDYITKPLAPEAMDNVLVKWLGHKLSTQEKPRDDETPGIEISYSKEDGPDKITSQNEIVNVNELNDYQDLFGDKFLTLINQYVEDSRKNIKEAYAAIQASDAKTLERNMHTLKSSSAQFGSMCVSRVAAELEQHARNGDIHKTELRMPEIQELFEMVFQRLKQEFDLEDEIESVA